jgi:hypothetical protein
MTKVIIVVEDKADERINAMTAIKQAFSIQDNDEPLTFPLKSIEQFAFRNAQVLVLFAENLNAANLVFSFAK